MLKDTWKACELLSLHSKSRGRHTILRLRDNVENPLKETRDQTP